MVGDDGSKFQTQLQSSPLPPPSNFLFLYWLDVKYHGDNIHIHQETPASQ